MIHNDRIPMYCRIDPGEMVHVHNDRVATDPCPVLEAVCKHEIALTYQDWLERSDVALASQYPGQMCQLTGMPQMAVAGIEGPPLRRGAASATRCRRMSGAADVRRMCAPHVCTG